MEHHPVHTINAGADVIPPLCFNNPFHYQPHPLCVSAAEEVRTCLMHHPEWSAELAKGKMFGVLIVESQMQAHPDKRQYAYLAAFSGQLNGEGVVPGFVPPIFDVNQSDYFMNEMRKIKTLVDDLPERKRRSEILQNWLFRQYVISNARGEKKSIYDIFVDFYKKRMLRQEHFLKNAQSHHIPSGTGECCAPKLLQYAFDNHLKPLCIAEFWVKIGTDESLSVKQRRAMLGLSEIRHDGRFYPACSGKCRPLMDFMLEGLPCDDSLCEQGEEELINQVQVVYEDNEVVVIDKPSGLLSVPGRYHQKSVAEWLRERKGLNDFWFVHRLDQHTSGLLVIAKDEATYKSLQQQFVRHEVGKTYEAWLDGDVVGEEGVVKLRMRPDSDDPPRQMIDMTHGKMAVTRWKVIERKNGMTHVALFPDTGRTHQLRVHCAHPDGLNAPIHGDPLYGLNPTDDRLALYATKIEITLKGERKTFCSAKKG